MDLEEIKQVLEQSPALDGPAHSPAPHRSLAPATASSNPSSSANAESAGARRQAARVGFSDYVIGAGVVMAQMFLTFKLLRSRRT